MRRLTEEEKRLLNEDSIFEIFESFNETIEPCCSNSIGGDKEENSRAISLLEKLKLIERKGEHRHRHLLSWRNEPAYAITEYGKDVLSEISIERRRQGRMSKRKRHPFIEGQATRNAGEFLD